MPRKVEYHNFFQLDWSEARNFCKLNEGMDLLVIESDFEFNYLEETLSKNHFEFFEGDSENLVYVGGTKQNSTDWYRGTN